VGKYQKKSWDDPTYEILAEYFSGKPRF